MKIHKTHKTHRIKKSGYGTSDIAVMCKVTPATIAKWIDEGKVTSHMTAGGHRRVSEIDLIKFMNGLKIPIPPNLQLKNSPPILIIDDDKEDRDFMARLVRKAIPEAKIHFATKGFDVGHKLVTYKPVIMLLDIHLPGMDGFDVCQTVRKDPALKNLIIVAVSGSDDDATKKKILKAGATSFLSKNSDQTVWMEKLQEITSAGRIHAHAAN